VKQSSMTVLSWNLDAQVNFRQQRSAAALELLKERNPDVLCLQEMEKTVWVSYLKDEWIQHNYYVTDADGSTFDDGFYGTCTLIKFPPSQVYKQVLPSEGNRKILIVEFQLNSRTARISNVHCDSGERVSDANIRKYQIKALSNASLTAHDALFMGDLNVYSDGELEFLSSDLVDCWNRLHPNVPGYTYDSQVNPWCNYDRRLLLGSTCPPIRQRFDRMFMNRAETTWEVMMMEIVGQRPIIVVDKQKREVEIFPSDHLGLLASFQLVVDS